jgi:hypothetical protein
MKGKVSSMFQVDDKVISMDIIEEKFICDLEKCKGNCCVLGVSGAPLEVKEVELLRKIYPRIKPYLRPEAIKVIEKQGTAVIDPDREWVTPLIRQMECVYAIFEDGIAKCAIEKAYEDNVIAFRKPVSCHLYPIRIKKYDFFDAVNYDRQKICDPARDLGNIKDMPVYEFVKDALIRKYGKGFMSKLRSFASEILNQQKRK